MTKEIRDSEPLTDATTTTDRVAEDVWLRQPQKRKLTDPLCTLGKDIDRFEDDPTVFKDLNRLVQRDEKEQIKWFKALREEWKKGPPETPMDAGLLVYKIMAELYPDYIFDADLDGFLFHYSLPWSLPVKDEHKRRATLTAATTTTDRVAEDVWLWTPQKQPIQEPFLIIDRKLTDPVGTLGKDIDRFEHDPTVFKDLSRLVHGDEKEQIKWFKALREEWKKGPPETPMDAGLLVYKIMAELYPDYILDADLDGFLFHYSLPFFLHVKDEHKRRATLTAAITNTDSELLTAATPSVWLWKSPKRPIQETNPLCTLAKDIDRFEHDPTVFKDLNRLVYGDEKEQIKWFKALREEWKKGPPETPMDAGLLVYKIMAELYPDYILDADLDGFLFHYSLPCSLHVKEEHKRRTTLTAATTTTDRVAENVWLWEPQKQPIQEPFLIIDRKLTDPVGTLGKDIDRFEHDPTVFKDLNRLVDGDEKAQIEWFKALREEWKKGPPESPMDAGLLVYKIMAEMYYDCILDSDLDGFLFHYSLPYYCDVIKEHKRRATLSTNCSQEKKEPASPSTSMVLPD